MLDKSIQLRGLNCSTTERKHLRKALHDLHNLEIMAANIYRCQIGGHPAELDENLIAAMKNEMSHIQDYMIKLYEYGLKPVWYRWIFWIVGWIIGSFSRLQGQIGIFKAGIWTESKAVKHYDELLKCAPWDEATYQIIDKDRQDEIRHLALWTHLLEESGK
jgi:demethoxyubiquinone hydroxylase (CLK1/Coq7/Cat5 family)